MTLIVRWAGMATGCAIRGTFPYQTRILRSAKLKMLVIAMSEKLVVGEDFYGFGRHFV